MNNYERPTYAMSNIIYLGIPFSGCRYESIMPCTREDEAIAIAAGMWLCGVENTKVFMQNSGLGVSLDVITSLLKPYKIRMDFHVAQGSDTPQHEFMNRNCLSILKIIAKDIIRNEKN